jgi:flagellar hook-basal body complex protein FliE
MNEIDVNRVLSQIRTLSAQAANTSLAPQQAPAAASGFDKIVSNAIDKVNDTQNQASRMQQAFELGDPSADLASVMLTQAKAQVSFSAMNQVRNRLVSAYQDIMNMPI